MNASHICTALALTATIMLGAATVQAGDITTDIGQR